MVSVTAKNTSFDEALAIVVVSKCFRYVAGVESSSFYGCKMSKCSSYATYKNLLGFFWSGRCCCTLKCSEILAHIKLLYKSRVNKVFTSQVFTSTGALKTATKI